MRNIFSEPLIEKHSDVIRKDNCKVSEVFELLLTFCTLGLIIVSEFEEGYSIMMFWYIVFFLISVTLYLITHFYVRQHIEYGTAIMFCVLFEAYTYSIFSGILYNLHSPSITVYALMVAACSAYLVPLTFTIAFHTMVAIIYCLLALELKPEYGVQDTINYVFFLCMSFILTTIIYKTRLAYLRIIDERQKLIDAACSDYKELEMAQQEMLTSQKTMEVALDSVKVLTWRYDYKQRRITDSSSLGEAYHLPKVVENVPRAIVEMGFLAEQSIEEFYRLYEMVQREEVATVDVMTTVRRGNQPVWYRQIYTPMYDAQGNYVDSIGIAMDITDQKIQELRYEEMLQLHMAASQDAIAIANYNLSQNLITEYQSKDNALESLGRFQTADQLLASTDETITDPKERKKFDVAKDCKTLIRTFEDGISHIEITHHFKDSTRWMQTSFDMIRNPYTGDIEAISEVYDITEKIRAELIANQLLVVDYQSILLIDIETGKAFPFQKESEEDKNLSEVMERQEAEETAALGLEAFLRAYALPDKADQVIKENSMEFIIERLQKAEYYETMYSLIQNGKVGHYRVIYSYLENEKDLLLCAVQDVTDMYEQQEFQKAELSKALTKAKAASEAKTAFLSRVSHDMRTPLNGILGISNLLKGYIHDAKGLEDLEELEMSGKYLLNLVNDTLDVNRIESGKLELHPVVCDGKNLLANIVSLMKASIIERDIQLQIAENELPYTVLYTDAGRIEQVIMNVFSNAVKFTPDGGTVEVFMRNVSIEEHVIVDEFVIRDNGIGMSEEFIPHIFEAFAQEDATRTSIHQGTGLGMSITKQILEILDGEIQIESELGKGTTVTMTIPMKIATDEQVIKWTKQQVLKVQHGNLSGKHVLLCEDHPLNMKIAVRLLEAKGILVDHAENGKIGVEMFAQSEVGHYDAVLMDIRMPEMDGLDATRAIRRLPRPDAGTVPILAMTANALTDDIKQTKRAGMNAHLSKPIQPEVLYDALEKFMKRY